MTRDDVAAAALGVAVLIIMAGNAAGAPEQWPWIWATWAAAIPFLALLSPAVEDLARRSVVSHPELRAWAPALLAAGGVTLAVSSASVVWWRIAAWPVAIALAVVMVGSDPEREPGGWRLLGGAVAFGLAAGAWDRALKIPVPGGTRLGFTFLTAAALALFCYRCVRPLRSLDARLGLGARDLRLAATGLVVAAAVALPLGLAIDFVALNPRWEGVEHAAAKLLGLTVFVGLPEELLFRGLIQEGLSRLRGPRFGWVAGSVLFGVSHITKPTGLPGGFGDGLPLNWRYALLATVAGLAYGWVYQRTRKVSASAVTHGALNWVWSTYFGR